MPGKVSAPGKVFHAAAEYTKERESCRPWWGGGCEIFDIETAKEYCDEKVL